MFVCECVCVCACVPLRKYSDNKSVYNSVRGQQRTQYRVQCFSYSTTDQNWMKIFSLLIHLISHPIPIWQTMKFHSVNYPIRVLRPTYTIQCARNQYYVMGSPCHATQFNRSNENLSLFLINENWSLSAFHCLSEKYCVCQWKCVHPTASRSVCVYVSVCARMQDTNTFSASDRFPLTAGLWEFCKHTEIHIYPAIAKQPTDVITVSLSHPFNNIEHNWKFSIITSPSISAAAASMERYRGDGKGVWPHLMYCMCEFVRYVFIGTKWLSLQCYSIVRNTLSLCI